MTAAVRDGIRIGALGNTTLDGNGDEMSRQDSIKQAIRDRAEPVMDIDPSEIQIFPMDLDWSDPDNPTVNDPGGAGAFMRVRVQYNHQFFNPLIGDFFDDGTVLIASSGSYRNENFILPPPGP
jgi:hypothetical protein